MFRSEIVFGIIGSLLRILIQISIWTALLAGGSVQNITLSDMVTFTILSFVVGLFTWTDLARVLGRKVKSGTIAIDLVRPINLKLFLVSEDISQHFFTLLSSGIPVVIIATIVWGIQLPPLPIFLLFLLSLILAIWLMYSLDYTMGVLVFWITNDQYLSFMKGSLMTIFSGSLIPLWFYPDWLLRIGFFLPYRLIVFEPISIFLGHISWDEALNIIFMQLLWIAILYAAEKVLWHKAQKHVFVQGG